jgi:hypothetical protein
MQPAESTIAFARTRKRGPGRPVNGATTRPSTALARCPSATIPCTWTEVSTRAPRAMASGM